MLDKIKALGTFVSPIVGFSNNMKFQKKLRHVLGFSSQHRRVNKATFAAALQLNLDYPSMFAESLFKLMDVTKKRNLNWPAFFDIMKHWEEGYSITVF